MPASAPIQTSPPVAEGPARAQRRFEKRLLLFFIPVLLVVAAGEALLWSVRETWTVDQAIAHQSKNPNALFMRGLLDQAFYPYKLRNIQKREPKILVLGSSRVMEFRAEMFGARAADFYNAGGMIQDLSDLLSFVNSLTNRQPEVVILGLDLWWFNESLSLGHGLRDRSGYDAATDWQAHVKALRRLKSSRTRKPLLQAMRVDNQNVGMEARISGAGFRPDGSMQYNLPLPTNAAGWAFVDREKPPVSHRITNCISQFPAQRGSAKDRLATLESALDALASKGVLVAGFLPPFSAESARLLEQMPEHRELWTEVRTLVPKLFAERKLPFVDASLTADLSLSDSCLIDGMHGGETLHLHLLRAWLRFDSFRQKFPGLDAMLERVLASPQTNPWVPDYTAGGAGE